MSEYQHLRDLLDRTRDKNKDKWEGFLRKILHSLQNDKPYNVGEDSLQFLIECNHHIPAQLKDQKFIDWVTCEIDYELRSTGVTVIRINFFDIRQKRYISVDLH